MLRWMILVVAVVFLTGSATLVVQFLPEPEEAPKVPVVERVTTGPQPKIEIEGDPIYQFGKMSRNDEASHNWVVKNTGEAPLEISLHGKTTCSCTVSRPGVGKDGKPEIMVVQPGQVDKIELHWHTKKDLPEDYSQGGTFVTNDPHHPQFTLTVAGKVYPPVQVYPPEMIQFTNISNEEPHQAKFAVYSKERPDLKLTKLTSSEPDLIVLDVQPMKHEDAVALKVEKGYMVTLTIKPGLPLGPFHEELIIQTDHPKMPEVKVSVGGNTYGPISVTPERVRMTDVVSQRGASRDIMLVVRGDKGGTTTFDVANKPGPLEVSIAPDQKSPLKGRYRMTVRIPPGAPSGTVTGDIVLKTNNNKASELKIPVSILITRAGAG